jgi:hypothetical protein
VRAGHRCGLLELIATSRTPRRASRSRAVASSLISFRRWLSRSTTYLFPVPETLYWAPSPEERLLSRPRQHGECHSSGTHGPPASTLTDNGMVFTTRLSGGKGGRNGFEHELRRLGIKQKNGKPNEP